MKHFASLLRHEIGVLIYSPATYIATVLFLGLMGFIFQQLLNDFVRAASDTPPAVDFFKLFWLPALFLTPLLTMHTIAEERRRGTLETLMTTPVTTAEVVLAKYVAAYLFYALLWLATLSFHWMLYHFAEDPRVIDPGPLVGGYLFVTLSGLMFIATGIFASSLTRSQLVAGLLAFALTLMLTLGLRALADIEVFRPEHSRLLGAVVDHVQVFRHGEDFVSGVFDTRAPVFYLSTAGFFLFLTMLALDARSARS